MLHWLNLIKIKSLLNLEVIITAVSDYSSSRLSFDNEIECLASCFTHNEGMSNSIKYSQRVGSSTDVILGSKPQLKCTCLKKLH